VVTALEPLSRFVETNGIKLHCLVWPGVGPTIVCTHGMGYNAWLFGRFGRHFAPEYRVVSVDLRGHGDSDKPPTGYHYADQVRDLVGLVQALGELPPILVGHSHGGRIGLYAAAHFPHLFSRIILADTSLQRPKADSERTLRVRHNMTGVRFPDWGSYWQSMQQSRFNRNWTPDLERFLRFNVEVKPDGQIGPKMPPEAAGESYRCLEAYDLVPDLARIHVPIAIVRAGQGNNTEEMAATLRRQMPQLVVEVIPEANHNIVLDTPDEFEELVRKILAGLPAGGR
jgi:pimeloyl-ACP methyl ester carboxylesterase